MTYRPDIDGLRAIAVLVVVLFHAELRWFEGGFVGVDVFFVISGYLITGVIRREIGAGTFSVAGFYERRVRRILPALYVTTIVTMLASLVIMLPRDSLQVAQSAAASTLVLANVFFWKKATYFAETADTKPLLHTWSLSVEEQFYLAYPLILLWLMRRKARWTVPVLVVLAIVSLALSESIIRRAPSAVFYSAPTRAWELLVGALLALRVVPPLTTQATRDVCGVVGLALVIMPVLLYTSHTKFPGLNAALPCLGAALVIHAGGSGDSRISRWLSRPPLVFVGLVSYSWYLWHWPVLAFTSYWLRGEATAMATVVALVAGFLLAMISFRWVEQPARKRGGELARQRQFSLAAAASVSILAGSLLTIAAKGWTARESPAVLALDEGREDFHPQRSRCHAENSRQISYDEACVFGDPRSSIRFAVWGDSYGSELAFVMGDLAARAGSGLRQLTYGNCGVGASYHTATNALCKQRNRAVLRRLLADDELRVVFLTANYHAPPSEDLDAYFSEMEQSALALKLSGKRVVLVYPHPEYSFSVPARLALEARETGGGREVAQLPAASMASLVSIAARLEVLRARNEFDAIDPTRVLCAGNQCRLSAEGRSLYFDEKHLSLSGARLLIPLFEPFFSSLIAKRADGVPIDSSIASVPSATR